MSIQTIWPLFNWIIYLFAVELYKLFIYFDIKPLSNIWFTNIFSHFVDFHFILLICFDEQKFFLWCNPTCWFLLLLLVVWCIQNNHFQDQCEGNFLFDFSLGVLVSGLHYFCFFFSWSYKSLSMLLVFMKKQLLLFYYVDWLNFYNSLSTLLTMHHYPIKRWWPWSSESLRFATHIKKTNKQTTKTKIVKS